MKTFVEINFATDGRDANAIAVMGNSRNNTGEEPPILGNLFFPSGRRVACGAAGMAAARVCHNWAEAKRIETKLWPRPHCKNVTNNSADAGGGALKGFYRAGMVV